jgi:hypothetical protein
VPDRVAVPSPLSVRLMPDGRVPVSPIDGMGAPVVVTVKVPADPSEKLVLLGDVMAGADVAGVTVSEKVVEWVVDEPVPVTVMVEVAIGVDDDVVMVMVEL